VISRQGTTVHTPHREAMGRKDTESFEALQRSLKYIQDPLYYASGMTQRRER
jgi:hypothetical protein